MMSLLDCNEKKRRSPLAPELMASTMNTMDIEQQQQRDLNQTKSLMAADNAMPMTALRSTIPQRIRAVRPEVINALSFLSVVWSLYDEADPSFLKTIFLLTGAIILGIDVYFIHCEWNLKTEHAIPFLKNSKRASIEHLDDLLSDLPQSIWVLLYVWNFKFSIIALVCGLHSSLLLMEDVAKMKA